MNDLSRKTPALSQALGRHIKYTDRADHHVTHAVIDDGIFAGLLDDRGASRNPLFMTVRVVQPNSRTLAQLPEQPPFDSLAQPAF